MYNSSIDAPPMGLWARFASSAGQLKRLRTVVLCGLFIALQLVVKGLSFYLPGNIIRISFDFLLVVTCAMVFGPVVAGTQAALADIVGFLMMPQPGAYFPGYTLSAFMGGVIYGAVLYGQQPVWWRLLVAKAIVNIAVNMGLNTLWLTLTGGDAFFVLLPARALKNLIQLPVDVLLMCLLTQALTRIPWGRFGFGADAIK